MSIHKIKSIYGLVALVLLAGVVFGFAQRASEEHNPTTHTVIIASECDVSPLHVKVAPGDIVQWITKGKAGTCDVFFNHPEVSSSSWLTTPDALSIKTNAPKGIYPYDVICGGVRSTPEVPGEPGGGVASPLGVPSESGDAEECRTDTRLHTDPW